MLRPGGCLVMAYPGPEHLVELRQRFGLIRQHKAKGPRYAAAVADLIGPPITARVVMRTLLTPTAVRDAILMGPNAHHVDSTILDVGTALLTVTLDINILFARKPERSS